MTRTKWAALVSLALMLLGVAWAFASPRGSSADDDFHLVNIWCAWGNSEYCTLQPDRGTAIVPAALVESACYARTLGDNTAGCLNDLGMQPFETGRVSFDPLGYSLGFYDVMRSMAGTNLDLSVQVMRIFNVIVAAGFLAWALLSTNWSISRALALSWGVALIPVGIFFIASVNPSSWTIIGVGTFWAFLASLLSAAPRTRRRTFSLIAGALAAALLALLARTDSGIYLVLSVAAVIIWRWKYLVGHLPRKLFALISVIFAALVVYVFWIQFRRYAIFPFSFPGAQTSTDQPVPAFKTLLEVPSFVFALFGGQMPRSVLSDTLLDSGLDGYRPVGLTAGVGWGETQLPSVVGITIGAAVIALIIQGLRRHNRFRPVAVLFLVLAFVAQILLMRAYFDFGTIITIQPRYLFPALLVLVGIALSLPSSQRFLNRTQAIIIGIALTSAGSIAWLAVSTRYALGSDATFTNFGLQPFWWWPVGPGRLMSFGIVTMLTFLWFFVTIYVTGTMKKPRVPKAQVFTPKGD